MRNRKHTELKLRCIESFDPPKPAAKESPCPPGNRRAWAKYFQANETTNA